MSNHQHKRSLEDYGFLANLKRRRHLSPQNSNIDLNSTSETLSSLRKKARTKSKNQSMLETSMESNGHTPRKSSSRHQASSSCQQMNEIHLPNWECMCPNIDQILSNKHAQSGVFAHEVQLVQQELEALLSMAFVRETILKDLAKPLNNDNIRSKIRKHQEAERVYSTKKIPKKKPPAISMNNHSKQNGSHHILDRQVALAPVEAARIDQIWSNLSTYHYKISSDDILMLENLVEFNGNLQNKFAQFTSDYQNQSLDQKQVLDKLQEENYAPLVEISQINPLVSHYVDRTTLGGFQTKLYEHVGQTSPVYKTPISSPMHGRMLGSHYPDWKDPGATLRVSPRLHLNHRTGVFSLPNVKTEDDFDSPSSSSSLLIKSKKKSKFLSSPCSAVKFQQRVENVQNYLTDQHLTHSETVKRQLFSESKSAIKKRKHSLSISLPTNHEHGGDALQSKLSTMVSLLHECSMISTRALTRARLQASNEEIRLKLDATEHDLESLIEKLDTTGGYSNPATTEKAFQNLEQLVQDWTTYEESFQEQFAELFPLEI